METDLCVCTVHTKNVRFYCGMLLLAVTKPIVFFHLYDISARALSLQRELVISAAIYYYYCKTRGFLSFVSRYMSHVSVTRGKLLFTVRLYSSDWIPILICLRLLTTKKHKHSFTAELAKPCVQ